MKRIISHHLLYAILAISFKMSLVIAEPTNQTVSTITDWTPPPNPNPEKILDEARADAKAGKYANALTKHVWFFQNALKYESALRGVRLSFALGDWTKLGKSYPPALEKLSTLRDEAGTNVFKGKNTKENFIDYKSINRELKQDSKTVEFFVWLDANRPEVAKEVFDYAEPALIKSKEYRLCGKYCDATDFNRYEQSYRENIEIAKQYGLTAILAKQNFLNFAERSLINKTTTLIALLVINDRQAEAQQIADKISNEPDLPKFKTEIQKALNGEVPQPWP